MPESASTIEGHIKDIQEISIAIDSWDDVFSDFDPSPLEQRILSEDFLLELRKRYRETQRGNYMVTIYAPWSLKDDASERIVIKRLKQYFRFRHLSVRKEINDNRREGALFFTFGVLFLCALTLVTYFKIYKQLIIELLGIILMPLGWFGVWEGLSRMLGPSPLLKQDLELFTRLSKAAFKFKYASQAAAVSAPPTQEKGTA